MAETQEIKFIIYLLWYLNNIGLWSEPKLLNQCFSVSVQTWRIGDLKTLQHPFSTISSLSFFTFNFYLLLPTLKAFLTKWTPHFSVRIGDAVLYLGNGQSGNDCLTIREYKLYKYTSYITWGPGHNGHSQSLIINRITANMRIWLIYSGYYWE